MLEGVDYINIDLVSPFFGEIVDTMCGYIKTAPVTEVYVDYV